MRTLEFWNDVMFKSNGNNAAEKISGFMSLLSGAERDQPLLNIVGLPRNLDDGYIMVSMSPEEHALWTQFKTGSPDVGTEDMRLAIETVRVFMDRLFYRRDIASELGNRAYQRFDFIKKLEVPYGKSLYRFSKHGERGRTCCWTIEEVKK